MSAARSIRHHYAFAFDLDTRAMTHAGLSQSRITQVYNGETPVALTRAGFDRHVQRSLYETSKPQIAGLVVTNLLSALNELAPSFVTFVKRAHVFRREEWSDLTYLLTSGQHEAKRQEIPIDQEPIDGLDDEYLIQRSTKRRRFSDELSGPSIKILPPQRRRRWNE